MKRNESVFANEVVALRAEGKSWEEIATRLECTIEDARTAAAEMSWIVRGSVSSDN